MSPAHLQLGLLLCGSLPARSLRSLAPLGSGRLACLRSLELLPQLCARLLRTGTRHGRRP